MYAVGRPVKGLTEKQLAIFGLWPNIGTQIVCSNQDGPTAQLKVEVERPQLLS